jgi:hypothetical protein
MSWFKRKPAQPPAADPIVGYNAIMDAYDDTCVALSLDGGERMKIVIHVIDQLEPSLPEYPLQRIEAAMFGGAMLGGAGPAVAAELVLGVVQRLCGQEVARATAERLYHLMKMVQHAQAIEKLSK